MTYTFCESVHASGSSAWHIRPLTGAGRKLGGGIDTPSLCGRVARGWDLAVEITEHHLGHACRGCVGEYRKLKRAEILKFWGGLEDAGSSFLASESPSGKPPEGES